jgi:hypothetical protein
MTKDFLICIDSDGCVFDSMTVKHRLCFTRVFIDFFSLEAVADLAERVWEHINLKSRSRGCNRFVALLKALEMLKDHPTVKEQSLKLPRLEGLEHWLGNAATLSNDSLEESFRRTADPDLGLALAWSKAGNQLVEKIVGGAIPPFPSVAPCLAAMAPWADIIAITQGPTAMISEEWRKHGLDRWPMSIQGQEFGIKAQLIERALARGYRACNVLVIGDSPCDFEAARINGARFYPIPPDREETAWNALLETNLEHFFGGTYTKQREKELVDAFFACFLPSPLLIQA